MKDKLLEEKNRLEKALSRIADKDPNVEGDWDARYPEGDVEGSEDALEDSAKLREEYETRRGVEHTLELKLQKVNKALERIEKGTYGICSKCNEEISKERLEAAPEAELCMNCQ